VPLAATFDQSRWLRRGGAVLLALHVLTPETWPFASREAAIPWDLTPMIPNAVGSLMPLVSGWEPGAPTGRVAAPAFHPLNLGLVLAAVLVVWAWSGRGAVASRRWTGRRWALAASATTAFLALAVVGLGARAFDARVRFYPPSFPDFYVGWLNFEAQCGPAGARVAYAGTDLPYYFLGRGLRNEVRYINVDRHRDWLLHDYHREALAHGQGTWPDSRPGWDRIHPDYDAWINNLDAEGIQLLVVTRANPAEGIHNIADADHFPIEKVWADSHPERFQPVYGAREGDRWFRLYRVRPSGARNTSAAK